MNYFKAVLCGVFALSLVLCLIPIPKAYAATVTVPISFAFRTGSSTFETSAVAATITCAGGGGTHDGNAASQNFTCDESVTVTVTMPVDAASSRYRFSDGTTTKTFTSCAAPGPCSTTSYTNVVHHILTGIITSGVDATQMVKITRTLYGTSASVPTNAGTNYALNFDGTDDIMTATHHADIGPSSAFSVSAWIYPQSLANEGGQARRIMQKYNDASNEFSLAMLSTGALNGSVELGGVVVSKTGTTTITANNLFHVVMTFDGAAITLYQNGASVSVGTGAISAFASTNFQLGHRSASTGHFAGWMDDVRVYQKVLSQAEVTSLFAGIDVSDQLKANWRFDEGSGTSAADSSGNGRTGTVSGTPTWERSLWVDQASTITAPDPITITSSQERYDTSSAVSFTNIQSAINQTIAYYKQFAILTTLSGLDAAQTSPITRTQLGISSTDAVPGATATLVWNDASTTYAVPNNVTVSSTERFMSYNTTGQRSFVVSAYSAKVFVYSHEYQLSSLTFKTSTGTSLTTSPTAFSFAMSNGTNLSSISNTWIKNGTATVTGITWRGLNVTPTSNTIPITSGGAKTLNTNIAESTNPTIQWATDTGAITSISYDANTRALSFTDTASGTLDTILEYPLASFANAALITVDGIQHSNVVDDTASGLLTINDVSFGAHDFIITFTASSGGGGGGGGNGQGSGSQLFTLSAAIPPYSLSPGTSQNRILTIAVTGTTEIVISSLTFSNHTEWFFVDKQIPYSAITNANDVIVSEIPITLALPASESTDTKQLEIILATTNGMSTVNYHVPVVIEIANAGAIYVGSMTLPMPLLYFMGGIGALVLLVGIAAKATKGKGRRK